MLQFLHGVNTPHCFLLKVIRPEEPNGVTFAFCGSVSSAVITFKPLHPLPP
jgi:hypothetical protein